MMKLSVIIPCYNSADYIADQLEALAGQEYKDDWEVIVSDNGSTDRSIEIIESYRHRLPDLRIVDSGDKKGAGHARNIGVKASTGDVLLFCDADDAVSTGWLRAMARALCHHDFVAGAYEGTRLNSELALKYRKVPQRDALQIYKYPPFLPHAGGGNLGVKRYVHERVGGFDESMPRLQDTDYCWKIQLSGVKLHFVEDAVVHIRLRDTKTGILKQALMWGRFNVFIYKKYRGRGMPVLHLKKGILAWIRLFKRLLKIRTKSGLDSWLWQIAWRTGRVEGCLRYNVLAL
jgi:glycosyltransferase involved in cell wall biosynthesis